MVLHRPVHQGGLGLVSVEHKAEASLLRTFLELATNQNHLSSTCLSILYRVHVLGENLPCPPLPPFYNTQFFDTIKDSVESGADVVSMTTHQWYHYLLECEVTMQEVDMIRHLRPCRAEERSPDTDWPVVWARVRLSSLTSEANSWSGG